MQAVQVGKIVNTHGIKGMLKVYPYTNSADDFVHFKTLYIDSDLTTALNITQIKQHKNTLIIKFKQFDNINDVLHLKNTVLYAKKSDVDQQLDEDEYYIEDLMGLTVIDNHDKVLGVVKAFRDGAKQIVLEIDHAGHVWYLPFVDAFVEEVDLAKRQLRVSLIEGIYSED